MKYVAILSLMMAFTAYSPEASAQTITAKVTGESCTTEKCGNAIDQAFAAACNYKVVNLKTGTITYPVKCDTKKIQNMVKQSGACPDCNFVVTITK
jgi:hypothetical protein